MIELKPTLYLDKGALGAFDLNSLSDYFQICYSEATLFDLLNDRTDLGEGELRTLNDIRALYYYRDSDRILSTEANAIDLMRKIEPLELEIMASAYRFVNGGGAQSLFDVLHNQLSALLNADKDNAGTTQLIVESLVSDQTLQPLKYQKSEQWHIELQRATKCWSQKQDFTLRSIFDQHPDLYLELKYYFPDKVPRPEQVQLAAMLLGVLQMGSDKGILSTNDDKSRKAAVNGYVDCLHVMFGLHCQYFLTTDKATLRRFRLLNDYWQLERKCALVSAQA
ncbi:hypothetical protein [Pseudotabrizicola formosa]|uniref:hypothetical protein n=1 Tax=Pseudotabrizicola formosa TaxID=2030009 RepID=UPI000CD2D414|nr:hypothetical protein [Pseudotabrizicola formosa]